MTKARTLADNFAADINAVTADAPLTGGGTSGTVTVGIQAGTTAQSGAVQLTDSTASTSTTTAATPNSVKSAYDLANGAIAKSTIDAKGDLLVGSANDTVSRLAVASTAGFVLTVDSAEATGLKWAAASSSSGPAFRVTRSAGYNIPSASTDTTIPWNTETFDTDNCFDTGTYKFTPNKAGYYLFSCYLYVNNDNGSTAQLGTGWVFKNGTDKFHLFRNSVGTAGWDNPGYTGAGVIIYANGTTDYFEFQVNFEGTTRTISSSGSYWNGVFVRGA